MAANYQGELLPRRHRFRLSLIGSTTPLLSAQETERLVADPAPGISATPHEDNLRYFDVIIEGPGGSPFQSEQRSFGFSASWLLNGLQINRREIQAGIVPS